MQVNSAAASAVEETKKAAGAAADAAGNVAENAAQAVRDAAEDDTRSPVVQQVRQQCIPICFSCLPLANCHMRVNQCLADYSLPMPNADCRFQC